MKKQGIRVLNFSDVILKINGVPLGTGMTVSAYLALNTQYFYIDYYYGQSDPVIGTIQPAPPFSWELQKAGTQGVQNQYTENSKDYGQGLPPVK